MNPLHNPYAYSGFPPEGSTNAPPGQEPAAGGPPWPAPHLVRRSQPLPEVIGYEAGPPQAQEAWMRTPPVAATVIWPAQASYSTELKPALAGRAQESQPQQAGWLLHADPGYPGPGGGPASMSGPDYPPPLLGQQPVLPAAPYDPSAPVPLVPAWGAAAAQAGLRAGQKNKRPAVDETASGRASSKRLLLSHPGVEVAEAAAGPSGPAWPPTRDANCEIDCPQSVLLRLRKGGRNTRHAQFECRGLKTGVISVKAVAQACSKVPGRRVTVLGEKGVYAFDNVVLTAGTEIARRKKLDADKGVGTVYLELGKAEDGTETLSDLHILIPETVSEPAQTSQTSKRPYANNQAAILDCMRSDHKGNSRHEVGRLAKQDKAEQPAPSHPFVSDRVNNYFEKHKPFFKTVGCEHIYQVNQLLRDCENALGGPPGDGEHLLTLIRGGQEHRLLWVVEGGDTTHLIDAPDEEQAQRKLEQTRKQMLGLQSARLAKRGLMSPFVPGAVHYIAKRREKELTALAWSDDLASVVRTLSLRCDMALSDAKYGSVKSCPEDAEVMEFHLQPPPESEGKPARGLRWVREGKVNEIMFFEEGKREEAIEKMAKFKKYSNAIREGIAESKKNAAARAGGADG